MSTQLKLGTLTISSPAFEQHGMIPQQYTGDGGNKSPPLQWSGVPEGTAQLALVCFDPDAPMPNGFTHWVVYDIPPEATGIPEGEGMSFMQGVNGIGKQGYIGPAPPPGHGLHHYYFWLYALKVGTELEPNLPREELMEAISEYVTMQARLVGTYER